MRVLPCHGALPCHGPPEGILSRLNDILNDMRELHLGATDMPCQPKDSHVVMEALQCHGASPCYGSLAMSWNFAMLCQAHDAST